MPVFFDDVKKLQKSPISTSDEAMNPDSEVDSELPAGKPLSSLRKSLKQGKVRPTSVSKISVPSVVLSVSVVSNARIHL
jgi:hypothetical protein